MELSRILALLVFAFIARSTDCHVPTTYYMDQYCELPIYMFGGSILLELTPTTKYDPNMRCVASVESEEVYMSRIMVKVLWIDVEEAEACKYDRLMIYDGSSTTSRTLTGHYGICGNDAPSAVYKTTGSWVTFNFTSDSSREMRGFKLLITSFDDSGICLETEEYKCNNGYCIDNDLECDGYNNCGDNSDESLCGLATGGIVGITVGCIVGFFILAAFVVLIASRSSKSSRRVRGQARPLVTDRSYLPGGQPYTVYGSPIAGQLPANNTLPPSYDTLYSTQVPFPGHAAGGNVKTAELQQY